MIEQVFTVKLSDYGNQSIGARVIGMKIKNNVLDILNKNPVAKILFDFEGIDYISTGFSKELFGELYKVMGDKFNRQIQIKANSNPIIKEIIIKGIKSVVENT